MMVFASTGVVIVVIILWTRRCEVNWKGFVWLAMVIAVVVLLVVGCEGPGPTVTVSPLPTPTGMPSPLVGEGGEVVVREMSGEEVSGMPSDVPEIGGFEVVFVIMGIVQLAKQFGVTGKGSLGLALVLGLLLNGLVQALSGEMLPVEAVPWVLLAVRAVGYTLAIPGLYDLIKDELLPRI